jgi:heme exporter protein CcmD
MITPTPDVMLHVVLAYGVAVAVLFGLLARIWLMRQRLQRQQKNARDNP